MITEGRGMPPGLINLYIERLPDNSLTAALVQGGYEHFGWGLDRHLAASQYDLMGFLIQAAGNWKKKPPEIESWPRPERPTEEMAPAKPTVTLADIFKRLSGA